MTSTTSVKLDDLLKAKLQSLAASRRRSAHWVMREAITQYIEREERQEQSRQAALSAWANYQVSGLHATAAETDVWLAKLEAGEEDEPPSCHI